MLRKNECFSHWSSTKRDCVPFGLHPGQWHRPSSSFFPNSTSKQDVEDLKGISNLDGPKLLSRNENTLLIL